MALISLVDDRVSLLEPLLRECIGDAATLVPLKLLEDVDVLEEVLEALALPLHGRLDDAAEGEPVERPESGILRADGDGGGSRGTVK